MKFNKWLPAWHCSGVEIGKPMPPKLGFKFSPLSTMSGKNFSFPKAKTVDQNGHNLLQCYKM